MAKVTLTRARIALSKLIDESDKWDLKSLSVELNRNHAYLQQYISRGSPRTLPEDVRKRIAKIFGIDDHILQDNGPAHAPRYSDHEGIQEVRMFDISASAGNGALASEETVIGYQPFRDQQLARITTAPVDRLAVIIVRGDSMEPTLTNLDQILVDTTVTRVGRDGIYIIALDDELLVKRCNVDIQTRDILVISDNERYPMGRVTEKDKLEVKGRVVWIGRALG